MEPDFSRLETVLRMEGEPDRVPFYEHLVDLEIMATVVGMPVPYDSFEGMLDLRSIFYKSLGYDYFPIEIAWPLTRRNFLCGCDTAWIPRSSRRWVDQQHGTIETTEDFQAYAWPEKGFDYSGPVERASSMVTQGAKLIVHAHGGVLENTMWLMGARPFAKALHTDRRLVGAIFRQVGRALAEAFGQASDVGGVGAICLGDDMGLRTGTMISPTELRRSVFPWHRRLCRIAHSKDLPFILHACGNLTAVMEDLIGYVGIDAKHSFEDAIMPVAQVRERWGSRVALLGGVDVDVLARRDVPTTVSYVREVMNGCLTGGCWALGSGNSIPNYVKVENYLAMLGEGRRTGRYPR